MLSVLDHEFPTMGNDDGNDDGDDDGDDGSDDGGDDDDEVMMMVNNILFLLEQQFQNHQKVKHEYASFVNVKAKMQKCKKEKVIYYL